MTTTFLFSSPKTSVIFMIGDGMGPAYTSTYRYYKDDDSTLQVETTVFDKMLIGMNSTYSQNSVITDPAAAGTALATGHKTKNGLVGVSDAQTVLEYAKEQGYLTAMAVTSTLTHATPASFISKGHHRDDQAKIAKDFFKRNAKGHLKFDFLMGAGEIHFNKGYKDFNLTAKENNVKIYRDAYNFRNINTYPFIAFTAYDYTQYAIDEKEENRFRVAKMTKKSLELLEDKPFFLMIESSQIDWCGHINDIACAMYEMDDFSRSVEIAKEYVDKHPNTLLIVTADHSTGGLALGKKIKKDDKTVTEEQRSKSYIWYRDVIKKIKASSIKIAKEVRKNSDINSTFKKYTSITLNSDEYTEINSALLKKDKKIRKIVTSIINKHSNTGWTTRGHTAVDVETFAYGKDSNKFRGFMDNTDIAKKIFKVLSNK